MVTIRFKLSARPKKLTPEQETELRSWYYSARTLEQKAKELGICRTSVYSYVKRLHKTQRESEVIEQICSV